MFEDRADAGAMLARALEGHRGTRAVVLALLRGGVVPGVEVAQHLEAPFDLLIARKIGHPLQPEHAIGAVSEDGHLVVNEEERARLDPQWFEREVRRQIEEARRFRELYLPGRAGVPLRGKTVIIVDDGIATGHTVRAAILSARSRGAARLVVAAPVAPVETVRRLRGEADEVVVLYAPEILEGGIGACYGSFDKVTDEEVREFLDLVRAR